MLRWSALVSVVGLCRLRASLEVSACREGVQVSTPSRSSPCNCGRVSRSRFVGVARGSYPIASMCCILFVGLGVIDVLYFVVFVGHVLFIFVSYLDSER